MAHEFLSDEWFEAVEALEAPPPAPSLADLAINLIVTRPDGGNVEAHVAGGKMQRGLRPDAPTTLTTPYDVAKSLFVKRDQAAAMQAFMSGQIKVEGDMSKLMAMSAVPPTPEQDAYSEKIYGLTEI